jgi:type IV pilus assembly protein PilY1
VYVGTGRYLHTSDIGSTQIQSYYAIKDQGTSYGSPRSSGNFMRETAVPGTCPGGTDVSICSPGDPVRTLTQVAGVAGDSLVNKDGWILDFPAGAGELQFTDSKLVLGTITFSTSIPAALMTTDACRASLNPQEGLSFNYQLNYLNGGVVGSSPVAGTGLGSGIATAPQVSVLEDGRVIVTTRMSGGNDKYIDLRRVASLSAAKRVSWRELVSD